MEAKIINSRYELIACTAIATEAGDTEAQPAILCRDMDACLGDAFCVYFGYALDELTIPNPTTRRSPPSASMASPSARIASD